VLVNLRPALFCSFVVIQGAPSTVAFPNHLEKMAILRRDLFYTISYICICVFRVTTPDTFMPMHLSVWLNPNSSEGPHKATPGQNEATSPHHHRGQQTLRHEATPTSISPPPAQGAPSTVVFPNNLEKMAILRRDLASMSPRGPAGQATPDLSLTGGSLSFGSTLISALRSAFGAAVSAINRTTCYK